MKYPNIASLVPAGEHFDESAIVNEGGYLSIAHIAATENKLAAQEAAIEAHAEVVTAHDAAVADLNTKLSDQALQAQQAAEELSTANATIATRDARIAELEAKVTELENKAAGNFSHGAKDQDEPPVTPQAAEPSAFDKLADELLGAPEEKA